MINFKTEPLRTQWRELSLRNPALFALVSSCAAVMDLHYGYNTTITSIHRPDDEHSVHAYWRGVDVRIFHADRDPLDPHSHWNLRRAAEAGWPEAQALEVIAWAERWMQYDAQDPGSHHRPAVIHGEGLERHVHFQLADWSVQS